MPTRLAKDRRREDWLTRFLRLMREGHLSEHQIDWKVVLHFWNNSRPPEEAIVATKDNLLHLNCNRPQQCKEV